MEALTHALLSTAIALAPFMAVIALLRLADAVSVRNDAIHARQIALTDAIHRELGAVAAPVVSRGPRGGWLVSMAVPLDRPGTTAAIVRITERMFASHGTFASDGRGADRLRILLTPADERPVTDRRAGSAASALPALT